MTSKFLSKFAMFAALLMIAAAPADAQFGGLKGKLKNATKSKASSSAKSSSGKAKAGASSATGKTWYVSLKTGSNKNDGSKDKPLKNIQKAINNGKSGDVIRIAEGNYLGLMKVGYIDFKKKGVSLIGGYSSDFSKRDPLKYKTMIQPRPEQNGTSGSKPLLQVDFTNANVTIDGMIFDRGWQTGYSIHKDPNQRGQPEGVESGLFLQGPAKGGNHGVREVISMERPIIAGTLKGGSFTIKNCIFTNASQFAIQMGIREIKVNVENNLFVNSRMAAVSFFGTSAAQSTIQASVEFAHNTILFAWARKKSLEDMGYGFRCMTGVHYNVHDNIIGCSTLAAIDKTRDDPREAQRKLKIDNNLFFLNKQADLVLPGSGKYLRIRTDMFEDAEVLTSGEGNVTLKASEAPNLVKAIDPAYLKGFINLTYSATSSHDPNSSENTFRRAMGMNQVGTVSSKTSMYHNLYPLEKALKLVGAMNGKGMQTIKE